MARGFELVAEPEFTLGWLWRERLRGMFLHFHWELARHYSWQPGLRTTGRPALLRAGSALALARFAARLAAARLLGYRILWTIHSAGPQNIGGGGRPERVARRLLARASHLLMAHDDSTVDDARSEFGRRAGRIQVVRHPSLVGVYPAGRARDVVRDELHIPHGAFVFLCFGRLRPDKGIALLLEAFRKLERPDVVLVVAGVAQDARIGASVLQAFRDDSRFRPLLGPVPAARVAEFHGAADAAVFPRSGARTSASLILALSLGLPAVAAQLEPFESLIGGRQGGWLFRPGDAASLCTALAAAASDPGLEAKATAARRQAEALPTWIEMGEKTAALMLQAAGIRERN